MIFLNNKKTDLDCRGALFISKCHIHNKIFAISDNDFMYEVNKINSKNKFPKLLYYYNYTKTSMETQRDLDSVYMLIIVYVHLIKI